MINTITELSTKENITTKRNERQPSFFYLSNYMYGGCVSFTAHLLHKLMKNQVFLLSSSPLKKSNRLRDFGYGIHCKKVPLEFIDNIKNPFITDMYENFHILKKLKRSDITIVIHDCFEIFEENEPYLKYWNIITIRKTIQNYLKKRYNIDAKFLYHPFYPYPLSYREEKEYDSNDVYCQEHNNHKSGAVSISRVHYYKNTDILLEANKKTKNPIKIYGLVNWKYVNNKLDVAQFKKCYYGIFNKSFKATSSILGKAKFMVDMSAMPHKDGGGTQYTFLEAIHNNSAIILNRKWIEDVDKKYRDFKEGYNCYAVSNGEELAELLNNDIDTRKIVQHAKKLMERHIKADWEKVVTPAH